MNVGRCKKGLKKDNWDKGAVGKIGVVKKVGRSERGGDKNVQGEKGRVRNRWRVS